MGKYNEPFDRNLDLNEMNKMSMNLLSNNGSVIENDDLTE